MHLSYYKNCGLYKFPLGLSFPNRSLFCFVVFRFFAPALRVAWEPPEEVGSAAGAALRGRDNGSSQNRTDALTVVAAAVVVVAVDAVAVEAEVVRAVRVVLAERRRPIDAVAAGEYEARRVTEAGGGQEYGGTVIH